MTIRRIESDRRMSQAGVHGDTVYLAGQVGSPGATVKEQTAEALASIEALLREAGSSKSKILSVTIWLADIGDFAAMNEVWDAWVGGQSPPVRATAEARLAAPGYRVEIIVVAAA